MMKTLVVKLKVGDLSTVLDFDISNVTEPLLVGDTWCLTDSQIYSIKKFTENAIKEQVHMVPGIPRRVKIDTRIVSVSTVKLIANMNL